MEPIPTGELKVTDRLHASKPRLLRLLDDVERAHWCDRTLYLKKESLAEYFANKNSNVAAVVDPNLDTILRTAKDSETGVMIFLGDKTAVSVLPPVPVVEDIEAPGAITGPLGDLLESSPTFAIVLLRLGRYALGVIENDRLVASKTGSRYVKNRHKAGGTSQRRFERSRERLVREIFDKTCEVAKKVFTPYERRIDHLMLGGEKHTLMAFMERCGYLQDFKSRTLRRPLQIDRPGHVALEKIPREIWKSQVAFFEIQEDVE